MTIEITPEAAELSEAEALFDWVAAAPTEVCSAPAIDALRIAGGVVLTVGHDTAPWSGTRGLGFETPITDELIGEVLAFHRARHTPGATFRIAPSVLPDDWDAIRARYGIEPAGAWVKLACETDVALRYVGDSTRPGSPIRIAPVTPDEAVDWGEALTRSFGVFDDLLAALAAASVGREGWYPFAGRDHGELVTTGTMRVHDGIAQFLGGATLPHARRRGGHCAVLAARTRAAKAVNCQWLVAEAPADAPDTHPDALHNLLRVGFHALYERRDWIWRADDGR